MARGAVHQVDGAGAVGHAGVLVAALEAQAQVLQRPPVDLQFGAPDLGVEVQVDRRAIDDLESDSLVVVVEDVAVQRQPPSSSVFLVPTSKASTNSGLKVWGGSGMPSRLVAGRTAAQAATGNDDAAAADWRRRPCSRGRRRHRQGLVGEVELGLPVERQPARRLAPLLVDDLHGAGGAVAVGRPAASLECSARASCPRSSAGRRSASGRA